MSKEYCECGCDKFMVWNDTKFKKVTLTCPICGEQKFIKINYTNRV